MVFNTFFQRVCQHRRQKMGKRIKKVAGKSNLKAKVKGLPKTNAFKLPKTPKPETQQQNSFRDSEARLKIQQKVTPINVQKQKSDYDNTLKKIRDLEAKVEKLDSQIQKKIDLLKVTLGIDKLEDQKFELECQIDELWDDKSRFEKLVIDLLAAGKAVHGFILRVVAKRFSVSYKAVCDDIFKDDQKAYQEQKEKHGSRKEQYVLIYSGEEVSKQDINNVA